MEIIRIGLYKLRNEESFRHKQETLAATRQYPQVENAAGIFINKLVEQTNRLDQALETIRKSQYTADIEAADLRRDETTSSLFGMVNSFAKHFDPEKRENARVLQIITQHYKGINRQSIESQTGATYNMLQQLREKQELLDSLELTPWVDQLEADNEAVNEMLQQRTDENAAKNTECVKAVRTECDAAIENLYKAIETFAVIEGYPQFAAKSAGGSEFDECIKTLNQINKAYSNVVAQREGVAAAKKEKASLQTPKGA